MRPVIYNNKLLKNLLNATLLPFLSLSAASNKLASMGETSPIVQRQFSASCISTSVTAAYKHFTRINIIFVADKWMHKLRKILATKKKIYNAKQDCEWREWKAKVKGERGERRTRRERRVARCWRLTGSARWLRCHNDAITMWLIMFLIKINFIPPHNIMSCSWSNNHVVQLHWQVRCKHAYYNLSLTSLVNCWLKKRRP